MKEDKEIREVTSFEVIDQVDEMWNEIGTIASKEDFERILKGDAIERFHTPEFKHKFDGAEDWNSEDEEDDSEIIRIARDFDICVIEEPLTCCDEIPEEDLTNYYDRVVEDPIEETFDIIQPEEKMESIWYKEEEELKIPKITTVKVFDFTTDGIHASYTETIDNLQE